MRTKVLHRHGATFDMPSWEAPSPGTIPCHFAPGFGYFPQREIFRVMSIFNYPLSYSRQHILQLVARKLTVIGKAFNIEIDIAVDLISNALLLQTLDDSDHLRHMLCRAGKDRRGL